MEIILRMKWFVLTCCLLFFCIEAHAQLPNITWWFDTHDASFGQSVSADIDKDGKLEIIFGCYRNDSMVYALNAEDGSLLWKYNTSPGSAEGCNDVSPIVFDVNGDDTLDVIVPSSCNPTTFCFHGASGKVIWQSPTRGSDSPPTIADVDRDGKMELLHGEFGGYVICLNIEDGSKAWEIPVDLDSWIQTAPTIVDLDGDTYPDFVVASWNAVNTDSNKIYAYRGYDQKLLWTYPLSKYVYHGTAVADLDKDGQAELIIGDYSGTVTALNGEDGSLYWAYKCPQYFAAASPVSVADIDDDGFCELIFTAWYKVFVLSYDGQLKWDYDIPDHGSSFRGVALSDMDDDAKVDIIFGDSKGHVVVLKGTNAHLISSIDLAKHYGDTLEIDHAPLVADFDDDGKKDVFIVGGFTQYPDFEQNYGRAYMISMGKGQGPDWLMFQHDERRRSSLCAATTAINEWPKSEVSFDILPNPNSGCFRVKVSDYIHTAAQLTIYNCYGKMLLSKTLRQSETNFNIETPGLYSVRLSDGNRTIYKKFIVQ
jgi:outer membrane protein assembly factor BamB